MEAEGNENREPFTEPQSPVRAEEDTVQERIAQLFRVHDNGDPFSR